MVSQCAWAIRNLLPTLNTAVGPQTIDALVELLPQFDFFEIVETYYLVGNSKSRVGRATVKPTNPNNKAPKCCTKGFFSFGNHKQLTGLFDWLLWV